MLKLTNVRKVFNEGTVNEKVALDHVSLTVEKWRLCNNHWEQRCREVHAF